MSEQVPLEVIEAFTTYSPGLPPHGAGKISIEKAGHGLINDSYKVTCELKADLFLQRINKNVFQHPEYVQENYICLSQYADFEFTGLKMPYPVYCNEKTTLFVDAGENYWRAFELIKDSKTVTTALKASQAKATAKAFGKFTAAFWDFNISQLKETIPGFHDLGSRYSQFEASLQTELYERISRSTELIKELKQRERYRHFADIISESGEFPKRVMHHDAKIGNILFHVKTGKVICPVDYDTAMPGYFFSDLGDLIRSMAGSADEENRETNGLHIRKDFYEAILSGYLEAMDEHLTDAEKKYIHSSGLLMIYMQALRFITDYLNGDIYYRTGYPEQNFDRAKNQLVLLQKLEDFLQGNYSFLI